ncbi:Predicted DNA-binding transcriptional regulator YafY, contains an HTH and WYL domains [Asanoa hainanensis]|uniref:Predicted DNA-binding transcriptional regulator YafY, contains an HTH and WYL domains n=1 Tax=Asanoa hainanensis TaxID=560556 RepID=A0A239PFQ0_9ACTN|nr:YafY family protein [Asanoa hainanensis]SNT65947.1 Predicted DNA-binding transcriptional regulator YafY, contains an HTH and WYL domains [Asanoa hainanensis]
MSHPASRVLGMLELLQTHHHLTGADLGARLGVDERTVRRYATTLADLGIPVVAARGRYGGYRLSPGYKLPPLMLTDDEAAAVVLGLIAAEHLGLTTEAPATGLALAKIRRVLPTNLAERLAGVQESLGFTVDRRVTEARPATTTLLTLGAAARSTRRVSLTYRSWQGAVSLREVDPYGLVFHAGRWYVTGFDHRRAEVRTFRLDRITAVDIGEATFVVPDGFDAVGHVTRSLAGVPYTWEVEVLFEAEIAAVRRRVPATVAEITETGDGVLLKARAQSLPGMAQMLAGLGWPFRIVGPPELRDAVREHAERLTEHALR